MANMTRTTRPIDDRDPRDGLINFFSFRAFDWANNPSTLLVVHFKVLMSQIFF